MKRLLTGFFILVFLFSCGNRKTKMDPFATITEMVDSAGHEADTLQQAEVKEEPEPLEADELFDDFIFRSMLRTRLCNGQGRNFLCLITTGTLLRR